MRGDNVATLGLYLYQRHRRPKAKLLRKAFFVKRMGAFEMRICKHGLVSFHRVLEAVISYCSKMIIIIKGIQ
jgi:hypothetical protein